MYSFLVLKAIKKSDCRAIYNHFNKNHAQKEK